MKSSFHYIVLLILFVTLSACSNRYHISQDKAPLRAPTELEMQNAIVTDEPASISNSKPYVVRGKKYSPMLNASGFKSSGVASWYGRKFHGYHTANGEVFNMFGMTAAHKTLPLPSFVKVTNRQNNKSIVVRVNDRGPFHDDRIIDLSYAAAYKLGFHRKGTADIFMEVLTSKKTQKKHVYIQVVASSNSDNLSTLARKLEGELNLKSIIVKEQHLYKLRLGPLHNNLKARNVLEKLQKGKFTHAFLLYSEDKL